MALLIGAADRGAAGDLQDKSNPRYSVSGQVLDPDGRPVAGASIYLTALADDRAVQRPRTTTDADGRFAISVTRSELYSMPDWFDARRRIQVIAQAPGFGPAWTEEGEGTSGGPVMLRLARDDVPIEGTIADLEGRPVAGAKVRPTMLSAGLSDGLDPFFEIYRENALVSPGDNRIFRSFPGRLPGWPAEIVADEQGRFRLTGVGRERIVGLEVEGPAIETRTIHVLTRWEIDLSRTNRTSPHHQMLIQGGYTVPIYHGPKFHHLAEPSRPIEGTIADRATGRPLAGVDLRAYLSGRGTIVEARSGADGRFRFVGLATEGKLRVEARPGKGQPYLRESVERALRSSEEAPVRVDLALTRGVLVRGRVIDGATKRGVRAWVSYLPYGDNPHATPRPRLFGDDADYDVEPDGSFELVALPGPGVVAARAWEERYRASRPEQWRHAANPGGLYPTANRGPVRGDEYHAVARIDPKPGTAELHRELVLEPGLTIRGKLVDLDGRPVEGVTAYGLTWAFHGGVPAQAPILAGAEFTASGVDPDHPRLVWFLNRQHTLGRMMILPGPDAQPGRDPITVVLQPCGTVLGRLLDADGRPKPNVEVVALFHHDQFRFGSFGVQGVRTDVDGRFRITGLVPGATYNLGGLDVPRKGAESFTVRIGEVKDLGDLKD
jgi:protocatechuate 3,4-dioxygenase beta subunit